MFLIKYIKLFIVYVYVCAFICKCVFIKDEKEKTGANVIVVFAFLKFAL